jgi:hypothetical protein
LIWSSALSLMLDGFASYATVTHPATSQDPQQQADSAVAAKDTQSR